MTDESKEGVIKFAEVYHEMEDYGAWSVKIGERYYPCKCKADARFMADEINCALTAFIRERFVSKEKLDTVREIKEKREVGKED